MRPRPTLLLLGALSLIFASAASAQTAIYGVFATGCTSPAVQMDVPRPPVLGTLYTIEMAPPVVSQFGTRTTLLMIGTSSTQFGSVTLPFDTSVLNRPGVQWCGPLLVSIDVVIRAPGGSTPSRVQIPIPNLPSLAGAPFFHQVLEIWRDRSGSVDNRLSDGGLAVLGT